MSAPPLTDHELVALRKRVEARADAANDPDIQDEAQALLTALDELEQHRRSRKSEIGPAGIFDRLNKAIDRAGGAPAFRRKHGISQGYLCDAQRDRDTPGPKILNAIGVRKRVITVYEVVDESEPEPPRAPVPPSLVRQLEEAGLLCAAE